MNLGRVGSRQFQHGRWAFGTAPFLGLMWGVVGLQIFVWMLGVWGCAIFGLILGAGGREIVGFPRPCRVLRTIFHAVPGRESASHLCLGESSDCLKLSSRRSFSLCSKSASHHIIGQVLACGNLGSATWCEKHSAVGTCCKNTKIQTFQIHENNWMGPRPFLDDCWAPWSLQVWNECRSPGVATI